MAVKTRAALKKEAVDNITSNGMQDVSGKDIRDLAINMIDSLAEESVSAVGDNIVVHRNVSTSVTFKRLLNDHLAGGVESPDHGMWLLTTGTYQATVDSITYKVKPNQFYYVAPRSDQAHLLVDLNALEVEGITEDQAIALINTAFANGIQLWARTAPANEDKDGNQLYPAADVLAPDAVQHYVVTPDAGGAMRWALLTEDSLIQAIRDKLADAVANKASIGSIQGQIRSLERHGSPNNFRVLPGAVDTFDDIARSYRVQVLNPAEIPANVDKLVVMVGDVGGNLNNGSIVYAVRNWDRSSDFTFEITVDQRRFFEPSIVDQTQIEIRFLLLPNDYNIPANPGTTSLGEIVQTDLAIVYVGAHGGVSRVIQEAVNGADGAGVTNIQLPANYTDWEELVLGIWESNQDRVVFGTLHTELLAAQTAAKVVVITGNAGTQSLNNQVSADWNPAANQRRLTMKQNDRIIYAKLR